MNQIALLLLVLSLGVDSLQRQSRIIGGDGARIKDAPYLVSIHLPAGKGRCGGSIVNKDWILTAAHCVDKVPSKEIYIRAGSPYYNEGGSVRSIVKREIHPRFQSPKLDFDYALLQMEGPLVFSDHIKPVSLPEEDEEVRHGTVASISGWGAVAPHVDFFPERFETVEVPTKSDHYCEKIYGKRFTDRMICAESSQGGKDFCFGDAGGPLIIQSSKKDVLIGVISWGNHCGEYGKPGVYARVSAARSWIESITDSSETDSESEY